MTGRLVRTERHLCTAANNPSSSSFNGIVRPTNCDGGRPGAFHIPILLLSRRNHRPHLALSGSVRNASSSERICALERDRIAVRAEDPAQACPLRDDDEKCGATRFEHFLL